VKYYPSLDESRVRDETARKLRSTTAAYRGRALSAWRAGADGVYLFNSFNPTDPIWRELGSPTLLASAERDYFASVLGQGAAAGGAYAHADFMRISRLNPAVPINVKPGEVAETAFITGEASSGAGTAQQPAATLRLQFKRAPIAETVTVSLNGTVLSGAAPKGEWIELTVPPAGLRDGTNTVSLKLAAGASPVVWMDLHCVVRPPRS
jgi:hypothetical protein